MDKLLIVFIDPGKFINLLNRELAKKISYKVVVNGNVVFPEANKKKLIYLKNDYQIELNDFNLVNINNSIIVFIPDNTSYDNEINIESEFKVLRHNNNPELLSKFEKDTNFRGLEKSMEEQYENGVETLYWKLARLLDKFKDSEFIDKNILKNEIEKYYENIKDYNLSLDLKLEFLHNLLTPETKDKADIDTLKLDFKKKAKVEELYGGLSNLKSNDPFNEKYVEILKKIRKELLED